MQSNVRVYVGVCVLAPTTRSVPRAPRVTGAGVRSLGLGGGGGGGQHAPLSQLGVQGVEDAELLLGLEHQQLLQHLAGVWASAGGGGYNFTYL